MAYIDRYNTDKEIQDFRMQYENLEQSLRDVNMACAALSIDIEILTGENKKLREENKKLKFEKDGGKG